MAKETIFTRITRLAKANINALIDKAEDPARPDDSRLHEQHS